MAITYTTKPTQAGNHIDCTHINDLTSVTQGDRLRFGHEAARRATATTEKEREIRGKVPMSPIFPDVGTSVFNLLLVSVSNQMEEENVLLSVKKKYTEIDILCLSLERFIYSLPCIPWRQIVFPNLNLNYI